jgi:aerobic-type carbon monoxide dehydrogenase small subunit (CoxS/CutS family)
MSDYRRVKMVVNSQLVEREVEVRRLLVDFLREDLGLASVHIGCEHGVCGTCTVLLNGETIRSCITFAVQADGQEITTVEALSQGGKLHPLQEAFWDQQGLQCGYCTPAMILRSLEILRDTPNPTRAEVREGIAGQLCRCTGYQFIVDAVLDGAQRMRTASAVAAAAAEAPREPALVGMQAEGTPADEITSSGHPPSSQPPGSPLSKTEHGPAPDEVARHVAEEEPYEDEPHRLAREGENRGAITQQPPVEEEQRP